MSLRPNRISALCLFSLLALPGLAWAHPGAGLGHAHAALQAALAGFSHPFTGADHLAAMLAVGAWSGLSQRSPWRLPLAFAAALLIGALLGMAGLRLPATEPMIAASLLVLGLLLASRRGMPWPAAATLVAGFALFHGAAHGAELAGGVHAAAALAGMLLATALLHVAGIGLGLAMRRGTALGPQWLGGGIACFGLALLFVR